PPVRIPERCEGLLVEALADGDVADSVVAVLRRAVARRVARPRGERDLVPEPGDRRAEHRAGLLLVEVLELVDGRRRHLRAPPEHDRAVLLVVDDLPRA